MSACGCKQILLFMLAQSSIAETVSAVSILIANRPICPFVAAIGLRRQHVASVQYAAC